MDTKREAQIERQIEKVKRDLTAAISSMGVAVAGGEAAGESIQGPPERNFRIAHDCSPVSTRVPIPLRIVSERKPQTGRVPSAAVRVETDVMMGGFPV